MLLSLTGICLVAGAILAGVNQFTAGPIAVAKATALEEAIKAVAPEFDNKPTEDVYMAVSRFILPRKADKSLAEP